MNEGWAIAGAAVLAVALFLLVRAFRRWRKRKAVEAMREQPWSPEALALLAEPLDTTDEPEPAAQVVAVQEPVQEREPAAQVVAAQGPKESQTRQEPEHPSAARTAGLPAGIQRLLSAIAASPDGGPVDTLDAGPETAGGGSNELEPPSKMEGPEELKALLYELPVLAGDADIAGALERVALGTLAYYESGLSQDSSTLPVSVSSDGPTSPQTDTSIIAGYLDLEQRLGRLCGDLQPWEVASTLLGALAARALGLDGASRISDERFVHTAVDILLNDSISGSGPPDEPSGAAGGASAPDHPGEAPRTAPTTALEPGQSTPGDMRDAGPLRWKSARLR